MRIACTVPCDLMIDTWLHLHGLPLDRFAERSRQFEPPFLAWEMVRNVRNPFFVQGTGFEGYLVGTCMGADQALDELLRLGRGMLESNARLHRYDARFRARLMRTLMGELDDEEAVAEWSDVFGSVLARMRARVLRNDFAASFQVETYRFVNALPRIAYVHRGRDIEQEYVVTAPKVPGGRIAVELRQLPPRDYDAGLVVWKIGRFGHPLVREFLHRAA